MYTRCCSFFPACREGREGGREGGRERGREAERKKEREKFLTINT